MELVVVVVAAEKVHVPDVGQQGEPGRMRLSTGGTGGGLAWLIVSA
jgi:hypothetical protein